MVAYLKECCIRDLSVLPLLVLLQMRPALRQPPHCGNFLSHRSFFLRHSVQKFPSTISRERMITLPSPSPTFTGMPG